MPPDASRERSPALLGALPIARTFTEATQACEGRRQPTPASAARLTRSPPHRRPHRFLWERCNAVGNLVAESVEIIGVKLIWDNVVSARVRFENDLANLLEDFSTHASLAMKDARIINIDLKPLKLELAQGVQPPNLNLSFEHSGVSVLLDGDGRYCFFQKGQNDDPIRWRYIWKAPDRLDQDRKIETDEFLDGLLPGNQIKYREYMPGLLSNLTFWINRDSPPEERMREVAKIKAVKFELFFVYLQRKAPAPAAATGGTKRKDPLSKFRNTAGKTVGGFTPRFYRSSRRKAAPTAIQAGTSFWK